jgi:hypothetical protein
MPEGHTGLGSQGTGGNRISPEQWLTFTIAYREGGNVSQAARKAGISAKTAYRALNDETHFPLYRKAREIANQLTPPGVKDYESLGVEARKAVADFGYFRERYLGRVATPWATHTAKVVADKLETPHKEFILVNEPPGVGKSTFWTSDLPAWMICRNRSIRIQIGSSSQTTAQNYTQQLRREFERPLPMEASEDEISKGLAMHARATLMDDFGTFKPPRGEPWTAEMFVVKQLGDAAKGQREPTVRALGRDTKFIGNRCNLALWDDLVDERGTKTAEAMEDLERWFPKYAESRLEPGGLLVLQGQRLRPGDLYAWAEGVEVTEFGDDPDDESWGIPQGTRKQYFHIKYKAHYDEHCRGLHNPRTAPAYDPENPDTSGCLLDPRRLTFRDCMLVKDKDRRLWSVSYQQEDIDPASVLVNPVWVDGGKDPETGEEFLGCWNRDRIMASAALTDTELGRVLPKGMSPPWLSYITADPSPTKFWSVQWWIYHFASDRRYLIDHARKTMSGDDFVTNVVGTHDYEGLLEDWWQTSIKLNARITHVIFERNAAQRWLMTDAAATAWRQLRRVTYVPHDTHARNKSDAALGVTALIPPVYRYGLVDLPAGDQVSKGRSMALRTEVTTYPEASTTDCLMAQWFGEFNLPQLRRAAEVPTTPAVMRHTIMSNDAFALWGRSAM